MDILGSTGNNFKWVTYYAHAITYTLSQVLSWNEVLHSVRMAAQGSSSGSVSASGSWRLS